MALISTKCPKAHYKRQFWSFILILCQNTKNWRHVYDGIRLIRDWHILDEWKMLYANFSSNLPTGLQHFEFIDLTIVIETWVLYEQQFT